MTETAKEFLDSEIGNSIPREDLRDWFFSRQKDIGNKLGLINTQRALDGHSKASNSITIIRKERQFQAESWREFLEALK